jgi:formylglycine-generating enzyme required for sulfatase activity
VVRGGSCNNNHKNARCAYRNYNHPDSRNNNIGFRVVSHGRSWSQEMRLGRR